MEGGAGRTSRGRALNNFDAKRIARSTLEPWLGLSSTTFEEGKEEAIDELRAKVELPFLKGYKCRLCSAVFVSITDLERHLRYWHGFKSPV